MSLTEESGVSARKGDADLGDYIIVLLRWWKWLVVGTLLTGLIGYFYGSGQGVSKSYVGEVVIGATIDSRNSMNWSFLESPEIRINVLYSRFEFGEDSLSVFEFLGPKMTLQGGLEALDEMTEIRVAPNSRLAVIEISAPDSAFSGHITGQYVKEIVTLRPLAEKDRLEKNVAAVDHRIEEMEQDLSAARDSLRRLRDLYLSAKNDVELRKLVDEHSFRALGLESKTKIYEVLLDERELLRQNSRRQLSQHFRIIGSPTIKPVLIIALSPLQCAWSGAGTGFLFSVLLVFLLERLNQTNFWARINPGRSE